MLRWGILSTAKIARTQMMPAIAASDHGVVAGVASREGERARALAARFGAPHAFSSYEAMLDSSDIDAIYIPLPTSEHADWAVRAADRGKHVLVEKPLALSADAIAPVIKARERNGVVVSEAFMVFYHPQWHRVAELIAEGAIGRLRRVEGAFTYFNADPQNMRNKPELGGGGLADIGVYPTVTTRIATGAEPVRVRAHIERDPRFGTDRYASVTADFGDFELSFYCATQMALRQAMLFHGEDGVIEIAAPFNAGDYGHASVTLHDSRRDRSETFRFAGVSQYRLQADAFARKAAGDDVAVFSLEDSVRNQRVIDAALRAEHHEGWETV